MNDSRQDWSGLEIAVIGMACRFPGAPDIDSFWANLRNGVESIRRFTLEEMETFRRRLEDIRAKNFIPAHGVLDEMDMFDAGHFGFSPWEADILDPQHRLFLETVSSALDDSGYNPKTYAGLIGVFAGSSADDYLHQNVFKSNRIQNSIQFYQANYSNQPDFLTTRVSYKLGLRGPSFSIQSACSTSLVAIHMACQQLLSGACDMAVAGGVSITLPQNWGYLYQEGMILSPDGHCRAFDAEAQGCLKGDGVGVVILKRLADALEDGDTIDAVILGSATNNDGDAKVGYSAPGIKGQIEVIRSAQMVAEVSPDSITYVEAHGTGTPMGDPIEVSALTQVFREGTNRKRFCGLGSVKSNLGHLDAAAGVASFIKTVLALKHQTLPPSLHFKQPNPQIDFSNSPFYVNDRCREWETNDTPRRAGVSSFGIGGTNVHLVLEEAPLLNIKQDIDNFSYSLIPLSARSTASLEKMTGALKQHLQNNPEQNLVNIAFTLQQGRKNFDYRHVMVARTQEELLSKMDSLDAPAPGTASRVLGDPCNVVFLFTGQGSQYLNMARGLYKENLEFRQDIEECAEILLPQLNEDIRLCLYPSSDDNKDALSVRLTCTDIAQPAIFTVEYALARYWMRIGIKPSALIGHSLGELTAACIAGVFSLEDALKLVALRGRLMQSMPSGTMVAVPLPPKSVSPYLGDALSLAAVNTPSLCVVSGPTEDVEQLQASVLSEHDLDCRHLHTSHAFHSHMMDPTVKPFREAVSACSTHPAQIPIISTITGQPLGPQETQDTEYWARNIRETVQFAEAIGQVIQNDNTVLLEVGPGNTLISLAKNHPDKTENIRYVTSLRHPHQQVEDMEHFLTSLGQLWVAGLSVDWEQLNPAKNPKRVHLPSYPFERKKFWIDPDLPTNTAQPKRVQGKQTDIEKWFYQPGWKRTPLAQSHDLASKSKRTWVIIAYPGPVAEVLKEELTKHGDTVVSVSAGTEFKQEKNQFIIDPTQNKHYEHLLTKIYSKGSQFQFIHALNLTSPPYPEKDKGLVDSCLSLLNLAQAINAQKDGTNAEKEVALNVLTQGAEDVLGDEEINPDSSLLAGMARVNGQEYPNCFTRHFDLAIEEVSQADSSWTKNLTNDLFSSIDACSIAYRNRQRWQPEFQNLNLSSSKPTDLRPRGVYLITGGLGKVGLTIAQYLAEKVSARLILVSRSKLPPKDEWEATIQQSGNTILSHQLQIIRDIEKTGAVVLAKSADVSSIDDMTELMEYIRKRFGVLNGVIHAAGFVEKDAIKFIPEIKRQDFESQFRPKVEGIKILEQVLGDMDLDFCMLVSSLAVQLGGLGYAVYSSANRFMDAFVKKMHRKGYPWFSVDWDSWQFESPLSSNKKPVRRAPTTYHLTQDEGMRILDKVFSIGNFMPVLCVSTGDLPLRYKQNVLQAQETRLQAQTGSATPLPEQPATKTNLSDSPQNETEKVLVEIWQALLGLDHVGIKDNFFELGGDSLVSIQMIARSKRVGIHIIPKQIFQNPTIAELAKVAELSDYETASPSVIPVNKDDISPIGEDNARPTKGQKRKEKLLGPLLEDNQTGPSNSILKADRTQPLPLSFTQERLWFLEQLDPGNPIYNLGASFSLKGRLDVKALRNSFQDVIDRHEVLRTTFPTLDGEPTQRINNTLNINIPVFDLTEYNAIDQDAKIAAIYSEEVSFNFDLETGPLVRFILIKISETEHRLLMTIHHIILDDWGLSIFFRDLSQFYNAGIMGSNPCLEPIEYQYADLVYTQRQEMQGPRQESLLAYWKKNLADIGEPLDLPSDRPRPAIQSFKGDQIRFSVPEDQVKFLRKFSRGHNATLFMTMLAVFKTLLHRYTGRTDIIVGTPVAQLDQVEMENLVGIFVNNLMLRTSLSGNPDFTTLLGRIRNTCLEGFEHQSLPFERLVEELKPKRDRSRNPLFQVMFVYLNAPSPQLNMDGLNAVLMEKHSGGSEYDLSLYVNDRGDGQALECWFEFSTALFDKTTIQRIQTHFLNLLNSLVEFPTTNINQAVMLSDTERDWLINKMNDTVAPTPENSSLHELIAAQAQAHNDKVAVVSDKATLTYGELNNRANQLAHFLISQGVEPGIKVGVSLDRDENLLVGLLGVLKAGGAYVPLDPGFPFARLEYMIENSRTPVILTMHHLLANLPLNDTRVICLDLDWQDIEQMPMTDPMQPVSTDQLAYVIYTSGSTGHPKGIQVTHANVVNLIHSISTRPGFSADDTILAVTTISFDIHVLELFVPLFCGGKIVIASQHETQDGHLLLQRIREEDITVMQATPATWWMMIEAGWEEALPLKAVSGGEKLTEELASALFPRVQKLWNLYGPTETTVWSAGAEITYLNEPISIHQYIDNTELYIMDSSLELVPVGVPGELFIGGKGVTPGYLDRPELTKKSFIENPLEGFQGQQIYRTGDLARYLPDGRIQLLGRLDHQIKLRGYRIEIGEIEKTLENHHDVRQAVVTLREDQPGDQRLVAYWLGTETDNLMLREWLKQSLPDYMVPSAFVWLKEYPKTPNNKIDRKALPVPNQNQSNTTQKHPIAQQSPLESLLVSIFQEVLQIERVGCYDNFFDLGGHSLLSMKVVARFEKETGIQMHPGELFQQTIGQIAAYHEQTHSSALQK